ncbi:MAG: ATP synthase F1 subunit gamma [Flavobacteriaceae bacterium]|nr:ATP synthase F1 subunit gamma [Flavobacteriaceae bacterium]|tara:strand:- start:8225 stop:9088 length:864 start_codon:yes stop_codon:yes gene_type:complete
MSNLKEIRNRIASVSSTMQITSAMKMVSAAKLKKATDAILQMRPYSNKLTELIKNLNNSFEKMEDNPYAVIRSTNKTLIIAITSNRGLCGAFNSSIIKVVKEIQNDKNENDVSIMSIGKKGTDILSKGNNLNSSHDAIYDNLTHNTVSKIADSIMLDFENGKFDKVKIIYNRFKNAATQIVTIESFLPIVSNENQEEETAIIDYIFEPSKDEIMKNLLPKALRIQLLKALKDSLASEHGARMTAMHKATDNAKELRDQLKLSYNKARQASITNEILEIVGGAEALKN